VIPWWALAFLLFGASFTLWGTIGLARLADQRVVRKFIPQKPAVYPGNVIALRDDPGGRRARQINLTVDDVAILIPAHNEGPVIENSLRAIMKLVPRKNIHVVSDGSTDDTFEVALRVGVKVIKTRVNVGKAGALQEAIQRFKLVERFPVVMLLDADTRVQQGYFEAALPLFNSLSVVAVAGCVKPDSNRVLSPVGNLLIGHRMKIYTIGQRVLKFGQTSRHLNATPIVPGFASIYRTAVLPRIDMNPPGLAIEDFNMTFEVYQKDLGKVGFTLGAVAVTQDPDNFRDYIRQTKRWALGLWQTVRRHPPRANLFTCMLALMLIELITSCVLLLVLPVIVLILVVPDLIPSAATWPAFGSLHTVVAGHMTLKVIFLGVFLPDVLTTIFVAVVERRPRLLLCAFFFPFMRVLDAGIGLYAIPQAWLGNSNGKWKSPARVGSHRLRARVAAQQAAVPAAAAAAAAAPAAAEAASAAVADAAVGAYAVVPPAAASAGESPHAAG
jgi:poly-beta-1,6-N-acetyl-D-glucosamine synthase